MSTTFNKIDSANYYNNLSMLFFTRKNSNYIYQNYDFKYRILKGQKNYAEAIKFLELSIANKDSLENRENLQKSYDIIMFASGIPVLEKSTAIDAIKGCNDIIQYVKLVKQNANGNDNITSFDIRIGVNSGPLIAGIIGKKKFAYDIWGDTVNVASRIEGICEPGQINISESTYNLVKTHFKCKFLNKMTLKNRSDVNVYCIGN
ncbi:MAG TPA: adenylate/guanylate cyclase domain-containing protein [Bacteroidia bacterium]|nr:adenylate/guanylate cyclase domain-containing protein [Bacteroidia bacterium]